MGSRNIGIDLHRNRFTTAIRAANGRVYDRTWEMDELDRFVKTLRKDDRVAVEMTTNTRMFHDAIRPAVAEVKVVNTAKFKVITQSVKKTDRHDSQALALFLAHPVFGGTGSDDPVLTPSTLNATRCGLTCHYLWR
ncbi:MAG: hypothetical protein FWG74_06570 [Planctomycetes bacterium]|nr:hypothetical protein [Planctomycetota bacterium]